MTSSSGFGRHAEASSLPLDVAGFCGTVPETDMPGVGARSCSGFGSLRIASCISLLCKVSEVLCLFQQYSENMIVIWVAETSISRESHRLPSRLVQEAWCTHHSFWNSVHCCPPGWKDRDCSIPWNEDSFFRPFFFTAKVNNVFPGVERPKAPLIRKEYTLVYWTH